MTAPLIGQGRASSLARSALLVRDTAGRALRRGLRDGRPGKLCLRLGDRCGERLRSRRSTRFDRPASGAGVSVQKHIELSDRSRARALRPVRQPGRSRSVGDASRSHGTEAASRPSSRGRQGEFAPLSLRCCRATARGPQWPASVHFPTPGRVVSSRSSLSPVRGAWRRGWIPRERWVRRRHLTPAMQEPLRKKEGPPKRAFNEAGDLFP